MKDLDKTPQPIYRQDYQQPAYRISQAELDFELGEERTRVKARLHIKHHPNTHPESNKPLFLHGQALKLISLKIDGKPLSENDYEINDEGLTIPQVPAQCVLESEVEIYPQHNTSLSGLYKSSGNFCTQCEAEGFRRITFFQDRPDVMAQFSTTITADKAKYPVLLSNGNRVSDEELGDGRHRVRWQDPFLKPAYLFAVVAGNLSCHSGEFITQSGRTVRLEIWVEPQNIDKCEHALQSLKHAMRWDEEVYGLEYDLDIYMIVAVSDFNMGAMENKGLNVFNTKYVLARSDTATDQDYEGIEGVIGHEYFHNWTGNRVTCRDWFQLTLKEGLTVFRDEQFSADMSSPAVKRIEDVKMLRTTQFDEDAGPMAHPIRPDSYIEMNNFYTATVYSKGAEVIRMYHTLLGADGFRKGMDLYFQRHDGSAVTCDDFRAAMADANGADFSQFERWYDQAGTPLVEAYGSYDADAHTYRLTLKQAQNKAGLVENWQPWHIPVRVGLLGKDGQDLRTNLTGSKNLSALEHVLELQQAEQTFIFEQVSEAPVPSLLRGFSAPVQLRIALSKAERAFLMAHDSDPFNRWDAAQQLASDMLIQLSHAHSSGTPLALDADFVSGFRQILADQQLDGSIKAFMLDLPDAPLLAQQMLPVNVEGLRAAIEFATQALGDTFAQEWHELYTQHHDTGAYRHDKHATAQRRLKNCALKYLCASGRATDLAAQQFAQANNMTDMEAALKCLVEISGAAREQALQAFYDRWQADPLVMDKWFAVQAKARVEGTLDQVLALTQHADFSLSNPNRVYALLRNFSQNLLNFHSLDGRGYQLLADKVLSIDPKNPQIAARLVSAFNAWKRYDKPRQALMKTQLQRIVEQSGLSKDVYEIVSRTLKA